MPRGAQQDPVDQVPETDALILLGTSMAPTSRPRVTRPTR